MAGLKETRTTMLRYLYTTLDVKPELFLYNPQIKVRLAKQFFFSCLYNNTLGVRRMNQIKVRLSEANFFLPV